MKRSTSRMFWRASRRMLCAIALLGLALSGSAQQPPQSQIAFKATVKGPFDGIEIPRDPPIASVHLLLRGQTTAVGPMDYAEHSITRSGPDRIPRSETGIGAFTAANGDAIFVDFTGLIRSASLFSINAEESFIVTGGRGQFLGATGSGVLTSVLDPIKKEITRTWDGTILIPKR
jgi:hypothetical protein